MSMLSNAVIAQAKDDIVSVVGRYVELQKSGSEFKTCCPFHSERTPSFSVVPDKGIYYCFGCGAGGDAVDFVQQFEGVGFREAVQRITGNLSAGETAHERRQSVKQEEEPEWQPIMPVPADVQQKPMDVLHRRKGDGWERLASNMRWAYHDAAGNLLGFACRFELPSGGKDVMPQVYALNRQTGEMRWRWMSFPKPRPLYGLDKLAAHPNAQVIICEGEKAAGAAQYLYEQAGVSRDKLVTISWPGGGKAVKHVDWSPLTGRRVGLWPDADLKSFPENHPQAGQLMPFLEQPGMVCMLDIAARLEGFATSLKFITPPEGVPDGWDLADEFPEGFDLLAHSKAAAIPFTEFREKHGLGAAVIDLDSVRKQRSSPAIEPPADAEPVPADQVTAAAFEEVADADYALWPGAELEEHAPQVPAGKSRSLPTSDAAEEMECVSGLGFIPLGTLGEMYVFWRIDTGTVEMIRAKEIGSDASILRLSSKQAWEMWCCGNSEKGKYDRSAIANMLIQISKRIGQADLSLVPEVTAAADQVQAAFISSMLCARPSAGLLAQAMGANQDWQQAGVWFDVFRSEVMVKGAAPCGGSPGVWSDDYDTLLAAWASMQWLISVNASMASEAIMALARQDERHPVRDYLNSLVWDGKPRLDTWLVDIAGCQDNAYSRAIGAKALIGAVARVIKPGCKLDTMLVLEGRQGLRKSSLIEALVPDLSWHSDSLGGDVGSKDAQAGLSGKWIIELAELANLRGSDVNKIKHFISDPSDSYRPFYARRTRDFPRQCVFIGTINPDGDGSYLHDTTGGRRFWPVECTKADVERMRIERDQLWAEARERYSRGETWWLTEDQDKLASEAQEVRQEENPWIYRVAKYLDNLSPTENGGTWGGRRAQQLDVVFTSDIFEAFTGRAYMRRDLVEGKNIGNALKTLGWDSKNGPVNGVSCRHWKRKPGTEPLPVPDDDGYPF